MKKTEYKVIPFLQIGNRWDEVIIPGLDYVVVEKTLGKYRKQVKQLNKLPLNVQHLVGRA